MNELINKCLYNWLGYGNTNGDIWFIGMEEGGAEVWRDGIATLSLEDSLKKRANFSLTCDFKTVWEDIYGIPLNYFKKITTWHFMSAFILAISNKKLDSKSIKNFLFIEKTLGTLNGNHFMCDLLPLPKKSELDFPYTSRWKNRLDYISEVIDNRFSILSEVIEKSKGIKLIIVYDDKTKTLIKDKWGKSFKESIDFEYSNNGKKPQKYTMHLSRIAEKQILFLFTPFFGQGNISYNGIVNAVALLKEKSYI